MCVHRLFAATEVTFSHAGGRQVLYGERINFNCSTPSYHNTNILEIGLNDTIEKRIRRNEPVSGNVTYGYVPEGCNAVINNQTCSKIMNITVTVDMHGKSYQCVSYRRGVHKMYYSLGGYITGDHNFTHTEA